MVVGPEQVAHTPVFGDAVGAALRCAPLRNCRRRHACRRRLFCRGRTARRSACTKSCPGGIPARAGPTPPWSRHSIPPASSSDVRTISTNGGYPAGISRKRWCSASEAIPASRCRFNGGDTGEAGYGLILTEYGYDPVEHGSRAVIAQTGCGHARNGNKVVPAHRRSGITPRLVQVCNCRSLRGRGPEARGIPNNATRTERRSASARSARPRMQGQTPASAPAAIPRAVPSAESMAGRDDFLPHFPGSDRRRLGLTRSVNVLWRHGPDGVVHGDQNIIYGFGNACIIKLRERGHQTAERGAID